MTAKPYAIAWTMTGTEIIEAESEDDARAEFRKRTEYQLAANYSTLDEDEVEVINEPLEGDMIGGINRSPNTWWKG